MADNATKIKALKSELKTVKENQKLFLDNNREVVMMGKDYEKKIARLQDKIKSLEVPK